MGHCTSKKDNQKNNHNNGKEKKIVSNTVKQQNNEGTAIVSSGMQNQGIIEPVRSQQPKNVSFQLKFTLGTAVLHEGTYSENTNFSTIANEFKFKLSPGSDYDYYLVNQGNRQDLSKRTKEPLKEVIGSIPEGQQVNIDLVYAGLPISSDVRKAYADTTIFLSSPKYDSTPFEIIVFDKNTSNLSYHQYPDESYNYVKTFNEFSAYCNGGNKLFISGSDKKNDEDYSSTFISIDLKNIDKPDHIKKLPNLKTGRGWHSMIFVPPKFIFIVGGINTKSVEIYDLETNEIFHDSNLQENRSEASLCCVNNSYLYTFCGFLFNNNFINSVEKCNLRSRIRNWEIVNLKTGQGCNFEPSFFSIGYGKGNSIILLGGCENQKSQSKNYVFELKGDSNEVENFQLNQLDEFFICSEKFFLPVNMKTSVLIPVFTSETVKILNLDSDSNSLNVIKFEVMENTHDDILKTSTSNNVGERERYVKVENSNQKMNMEMIHAKKTINDMNFFNQEI